MPPIPQGFAMVGVFLLIEGTVGFEPTIDFRPRLMRPAP
jgi:hypothetical protein